MNIVKTSDGRYIELQGTAEKTPFDRARLGELLELADLGISRLVAIQQSVLGPLS
jgi:ribonuclease PH